MQYMHSLIDQLHLAGKHLHDKTSAYDRFALILVDNAVELMVHHKATFEVRWRSKFPIPQKPALSPAKRKSVLGQYLDPKTAFCHEIGWISEAERKFIDACHAHRNELYHVGIRHEAIIHALASVYHDFACDLLIRDHGPVVSTSNDETPSAYVLIHTSGQGIHARDADQRKKWANSLRKVKPPLRIPLPVVLAEYAKGATDDLAEAFEFLLSDGNPEKLSAIAYLTQLQFFDDVGKRIAVAGEKGVSLAAPEQYKTLVEEVRKRRRCTHLLGG